MARKRNKTNSRNYSRKQTRVASRNTNRSRLRSAIFNNQYSNYNHRFVEDRRTYNPTYKPRTVSGKTATVTHNATDNRLKNNTTTPLPYSGKFENFKKVMICVRRKQRKEVLHAYKKTGKGGQRRPHRNQYSNIKCGG